MHDEAMKNALIIDNNEITRQITSEYLGRDGFQTSFAETEADAVNFAVEKNPSLIIMNVQTGELETFSILKKLKNNPKTQNFPIIALAQYQDKDARIKAIDLGADDVIAKPIDAAELKIRVKNLLKLKECEMFIIRHNEHFENELKRRTIRIKNAFIKVSSDNQALRESEKIIKKSYIDTVHKLTVMAEMKEHGCEAHIKRVGRLCAELAAELGWPENEVETIYYASPMHDIGKIAIPAEILLKPHQLTQEEFDLMKTHTTLGANLLKDSDSEILQMAERIARHHHEQWDGSGYPDKLRGPEIPVEASIMQIVALYDALRSKRPYRSGLSHEQSLYIMTNGDGRTEPHHFNPQILTVFKDTHSKFQTIYDAWEAMDMNEQRPSLRM